MGAVSQRAADFPLPHQTSAHRASTSAAALHLECHGPRRIPANTACKQPLLGEELVIRNREIRLVGVGGPVALRANRRLKSPN
jgi:hypothetical protein